jgi:hypothetical protein
MLCCDAAFTIARRSASHIVLERTRAASSG